jgi:hypothetical protein
MLDMSKRDLGWKQLEDLVAKGEIAAALCDDTGQEQWKPWTYQELPDQLPRLILNNISGSYYWHLCFSNDGKEPGAKWKGAQSNRTLPEWSGEETLVSFIQKSFISPTADGVISIYPSNQPGIIRIRYVPRSAPYRPFADMRHFRVDLICAAVKPTSPDEVRLVKREADYNICAVVRLADDQGSSDDVRTCWKDGHEIVPAHVGVIRDKDYEASLPRWTVASQGMFDLYYYKLSRPHGWKDRGSGIDESALEYEEREWVQEELRAQELNKTPSSSAIQPSSLLPASTDIAKYSRIGCRGETTADDTGEQPQGGHTVGK